MSSTRRKLQLNTASVDLGCGSCRRTKLSRIFNPKPKPKTPKFNGATHLFPSSSATSTTSLASPNAYSSSFSDNEADGKRSKTSGGFRRVAGDSVAVEKDSEDPYLDFRQSMLQMILEKEIYTKEDLRELLNCFLLINSPCHHGIIIRAFAEIWNGVFSVRSALQSPANYKTGDFAYKPYEL